jgi:hypothetical protein
LSRWFIGRYLTEIIVRFGQHGDDGCRIDLMVTFLGTFVQRLRG